MSDADIRTITAPESNVVVRASAGTGKTWLLVARVIRLLLSGAPPGSILAITFTRKAAAEIDARVSGELLALAGADEDCLRARLQAFGLGSEIPPDTLRKARHLFEAVAGAEPGLRATTFHAFCADLLRRFPLEAAVPAGFDLTETTSELENLAWEALARDAQRNPDAALGRDFDSLLQKGLYTARETLTDFLRHRSDWWAYTEDHEDPLALAETRLRDFLGINPDTDPAIEFCADTGLAGNLERYAALIERHDIAANLRRAACLRSTCDRLENSPQLALEQLCDEFLDNGSQFTPLKKTKVLEKRLGSAALEELAELDSWLGVRIAAAREAALRLNTYRVSIAWYRCGQGMLDHYQSLKEEQHLLDFGDLEWKTYRLLNHGQSAEWVQYKLDQRIDHLLVDEFQDTNPTQWRLLLPLLQEIAAGSDRQRSVFLVGDEKQSIYRFRRAEARLFSTARKWLVANMPTEIFSQHISWRSSPAIIRFVNLVFGGNHAAGDEPLLPDFNAHDTHRAALWGSVEILPLVGHEERPAPVQTGALRNPLEQPRVVETDDRHENEGMLIAARIRELVGRPVGADESAHLLDYGDIIILLRDRNHAHAYEHALRQAGIPYVGAGRGALLDTLEVRDMLHLVRFLIAPQDNLALASVLRSPVFDCANEDLTQLAQAVLAAPAMPSWFAHLQAEADSVFNPRMARAARLLSAWRDAVDRVPVHDLLDRIYNEGNVIERYVCAAPPHLQSRFSANLSRFLELALEIDSGRFPSLARFHERLEAMRGNPNEAPQEPPSDGGTRVRILTIHAVKGLEAAAIFLADTARDPHSERGLRALIRWPVDSPRPQRFQLAGLKADQDSLTRQEVAAEQVSAAREDTNLLYVALTRAKQILVVTGCESNRGNGGWYKLIENRLLACGPQPELEIENPAGDAENARFRARLSFGDIPAAQAATRATESAPAAIDPALTRSLPITATQTAVAPSRMAETAAPEHGGLGDDEAARRRGTAMHRMLQRLTETVSPQAATGRDAMRESLRRELVPGLDAEEFVRCWNEACALLDEPALRPWFDSSQYDVARNEVAILFHTAGQEIYGIVDRIVLTGNDAVVIDYKTHAGVSSGNAAQLAARYAPQLRLYAAGVARLWPDRRIRAIVVFTALRSAVEISLASGT